MNQSAQGVRNAARCAAFCRRYETSVETWSMEETFHRESAKIYTFVAMPRQMPGPRIEPRFFSAEVVPLRCVHPETAEARVTYADFGSSWYHDAAIEQAKPFGL